MTQKRKILVVDDDPSITRLIKMNLEETHDYLVRVENQSFAALAAAEEFEPDLILLDLIMPEPDGCQLAALLRSRRQLNGVPIAFLTAAATEGGVTSHGGQVGSSPFIAKPVSLTELIDRIDELIEAGAQ